MKNFMENYNQNRTNPFEHFSDEEILRLLNAASYSANVRWEAIRRRIIRGEYDAGQSGKDSLFMLNRLAFFSELNKKTVFENAAMSSGIGESDHLGYSSGFDPEKQQSEENLSANDIPGLIEDTSEKTTAFPVTENREITKKSAPSSEKSERVTALENFNASPFLRWIKAFDNEEEAAEIGLDQDIEEKSTDDLCLDEKSDKIESKSKKNKKSKKYKKDRIKSEKSKVDLTLNPEIVSETLADLLASQGHFDEANEMYRQLGIKYPEKSSYFASKLKKS
jgi:hypothetical protein